MYKFVTIAFCVFSVYQVTAEEINLKHAISQTLLFNASIKAAQKEIESSELEIKKAIVDQIPDVTLNVQGGKDYTRTSYSVKSDYGSGEISAKFEIFNGLKKLTYYKKTKTAKTAALYTEEAIVQDILHDLIISYLFACQCSALIKLEEQNIQMQMGIQKKIEALKNEGLRPYGDLLLQNTVIEQSRGYVSSARKNYELSLINLQKIMGTQLLDDIQVIQPDIDSICLVFAQKLESILTDSLYERSDIKRNKCLLDVQKYQVAIAKKSMLPDLSFNIISGRTYQRSLISPSVSNYSNETNYQYFIGLNLSLPLTSRIPVGFTLKQTQIDLEQISADLEESKRVAFIDFSQASIKYQNAVREHSISIDELKFAHQANEFTLARYDAGTATLSEVSYAQTLEKAALQDSINSKNATITAVIDLAYVSGKLPEFINCVLE